MFFVRAHLRKWLAAAVAAAAIPGPAVGCGAMAGQAQIADVDARLDLRLADGRSARFAGLDFPSPGAARERLVANGREKPLRIAVLAPRPDRWGRWLVDLADSGGASLSDDLLKAGLTRVKPEFETRGCEAARLAAEAQARDDGLGLWDDPDAILDASDVAALAGAGAGLVVVEGVVRKVGAGRSRFYLDFGGRGGFTVIVARRAEAAFRRRGLVLPALAGQTVRVRGYIDDRFGPRIEVVDPMMIEPTDNFGGSRPGG